MCDELTVPLNARMGVDQSRVFSSCSSLTVIPPSGMVSGILRSEKPYEVIATRRWRVLSHGLFSWKFNMLLERAHLRR